MSTTKQRDSKRILSVKIKRMLDDSPDTSWLGEFADDDKLYAIVATGEHAGEFVDQLPCECDHANWQHAREGDERTDREIGACYVKGCDCEDYDPISIERGREYRYFNPNADNYKGEDDADTRKYCQQDYKRIRELIRGDFCFIGIAAEASITLANDARGSSVIQRIHSGGLWGIESDSDNDYLESVEREELDGLRSELEALGFKKRAVSAAMRSVEHVSA